MSRPPIRSIEGRDVVPEAPPPAATLTLPAREVQALRGEVAGGLLVFASILGASERGGALSLESIGTAMHLLEQAMRRLGVPLGDDMGRKVSRLLGAFNAGRDACDCDECTRRAKPRCEGDRHAWSCSGPDSKCLHCGMSWQAFRGVS